MRNQFLAYLGHSYFGSFVIHRLPKSDENDTDHGVLDQVLQNADFEMELCVEGCPGGSAGQVSDS